MIKNIDENLAMPRARYRNVRLHVGPEAQDARAAVRDQVSHGADWITARCPHSVKLTGQTDAAALCPLPFSIVSTAKSNSFPACPLSITCRTPAKSASRTSEGK